MKKSFKDLFKDDSPQRIVYEDAYRRIGREHLNRIANKRELSEKDVEQVLDNPESLCEIIGHILDPLFGAVSTKNDKTRGEFLYSYEGAPKEKYFSWFHRYDHKIFEDIFSDDLSIDKEYLRSAASNYIKNSDFQDEWLDWYCADLLCYSEYIEFSKALPLLSM